MYCSKCGKEIKDDAVFCPYCGTPVKTKSQQSAKEPSYASANNTAGYRVSYASSASWVTSAFGSGLFLAISILTSMYVVLYLFSSLSFVRLVLAIPRAVICIGCWLAYMSCRNNRPESTGFSMIRYGLISLLFLYCLPALIVLLRILYWLFDSLDTTGQIIMIIIVVLYLLLIVGLYIWSKRRREGQEDKPDLATTIMGIIIMGIILGFICFIIDDLALRVGFISLLFAALLISLWPSTTMATLAKNEIRNKPTAYLDTHAILDIIYLSCFLVLYIIQFFAISYIRGMISSFLSALESIPFIGSDITAVFVGNTGKTIASLFLITVTICVIILLYSIIKLYKNETNGTQN